MIGRHATTLTNRSPQPGRSPQRAWTLGEVISCNPDLRYHHQKILRCLYAEYDPGSDRFLEVSFNRLVRQARIGKNKASEYLAFLIRKKLVETRTDGYRRYFKISSIGVPMNIFRTTI